MNTKTDHATPDDPATSGANVSSHLARQRKPRFALFIATAAGIGYFPKAPGTLGSLAGLLVAVLPAWLFFASTAIFIAAKRGDASVFVTVSTWYSDPFLWAQIALTLLIAGVGVWASNLVAKCFREKDPQCVVIDEVSGQHLTLLLGCGVPVWWKAAQPVFEHVAARPHHLAFGPQLEIFAPGFYTFSSIRHLEALPSPSGRITARRLGYHGRRLDRGQFTRPSAYGSRAPQASSKPVKCVVIPSGARDLSSVSPRRKRSVGPARHK